MKLLRAFALVSAAACLHAQTPATVNVTTPTACITSLDQVPTANGTLTVYAPGRNSSPAPFTSQIGLVLANIASRSIAGGQIVGTLTIPNPAVTSPTNVGYTFTIQDNTARTTTTYANVAVTPDGSGNWNLCSLQAGSYQTAFPSVYFTLNSFSLTTLGTSGPATFDNGTLNIPQYAGGSGNPPAGTGIATVVDGDWGATIAQPTGVVVGTSDTQTLTNKTLDGVTPATMAFVDPTSSIQTQLNGKQATLGYTPAHNGANSDITSLSGLTTPLSPTQGGTGAAALAGYRYANGSSADTASTTIPMASVVGSLLHSQLPPLVSGDIPNNAANTTGAAASLSASSALPNGTTATTQAGADGTTKVATDAFVQSALPTALPPNGSAGGDLTGTYPAPTLATVSTTSGTCGDATHVCQVTTNAKGLVIAQAVVGITSGGTGTVTSFSAGNLSPLFTTSVATQTSTPALSFTLSSAAQNSVLAGPASGGAGAPSYQTAPALSAANMTSFPTLNQSTTGNAATATTAANLSGTPAVPNGTTATTQTSTDNSTKLATTAFVETAISALPLSCQPGLGDGLNAIPAGTYLQTTCRNETGQTWTLTAIRCVADSGSSTCNATNGAGTDLLTGAVTGTSTYANGTQSSTTTIANGDYLKITFVADGTSKQIGIDVAGTY